MKLVDNIKQSLSFPSELVAIEACFTSKGAFYGAVHLKREKDEIVMGQMKAGNNSNQVLETFPSNLPVFIILTGRRVLVKEVKNTGPDIKEEVVMSRAFPNVALDDLIYNIHTIHDQVMASVVRKDFMGQLIEEISSSGHRLVDASIGIYSIWPLLEQLPEEELHLGYHHINLKTQTIQHLEEAGQNELQLMGESIPAQYAIPFAFGLNTMARGTYNSDQEQISWYRRDWQFHNLYKKSVMGGVLGVFILLLISFLLFNHYHNANQTLNQGLQSYDSQLKMVESLRSSYNRKQQFLEVNGGSNSAFSMMADEVAATVSAGISLEQMSFYPLEKYLKKEKLVRFQRDQLILKGSVENYVFFQKWLDKLNAFEWTGDLKITGYQEENDNHDAHFNLKVHLQ